jgi:hypothetical protein
MNCLSVDSPPLTPIKAHIVFVRAMSPSCPELLSRNIVQQQFVCPHQKMCNSASSEGSIRNDIGTDVVRLSKADS